MIDLRTGVPGSGKTLSAVQALALMLARFEKHPEEARPVFVHGIKDLALPHAVLPMKSVQVGKTVSEVPDWEAIPHGSYVLIDEAQRIFPPRGTGSVIPGHVEYLQTARHEGLDITLITQHPKLLDTAVRVLVGKHQHFRRLFGRQIAVCYEWDCCSDTLGGLANAVCSKFSYPKNAYKFYKSAEVHTKQSFRLPKWLLIPVVGVVAGVILFPLAYKRVVGLGDTSKARASIQAAGGAPAPVRVASSAAAPLPSVAASQPDIVMASALSFPVAPIIAGCILVRDRCSCLDKSGGKAPLDADMCKDLLSRVAPVEFAQQPTQGDRHTQMTGDLSVLAYMHKPKEK